MLDEAEIRMEIARLEYEESSYPNYAKLANLYTIQDRMRGRSHVGDVTGRYFGAPAPQEDARMVGEYGDSDFLRAVAGKDAENVWAVMDELMATLSLVNRKAYESVMQKIRRM